MEETEDVINAIREAGRLASLAGATPDELPTPGTTPDVLARLANAWALVALARAVLVHANRFPSN